MIWAMSRSERPRVEFLFDGGCSILWARFRVNDTMGVLYIGCNFYEKLSINSAAPVLRKGDFVRIHPGIVNFAIFGQISPNYLPFVAAFPEV